MDDHLSLKEIQNEWHGTLKAYIIGFLGSILLTAGSFLLVVTQVVSGQVLIYSLIALALAQAVVQLLFFMHLGQEPKPRWESGVFYFMLIILLIIALGSLWIMHDLNDRVMHNMTMESTHD